MKVVHVYPSSCEYAYPQFLETAKDPDAFDLQIVAKTDLELRYLRGLTELGVDSVLIYPTRRKVPSKHFMHDGGYRMVRCPVSCFRGKLGREISIPVLHQLKMEFPDVVHFHGIYRSNCIPDMFDLTSMFCRRSRLTFVGQHHTMHFPFTKKGWRMPIWKRVMTFPRRMIKVAALRNCAGLCSVKSEELERLFDEISPEYYGYDLSRVRHCFLPNTFDSKVFYRRNRVAARKGLGIPLNGQYILMVARLFREKGLHHIVRVLPQLKLRVPDVHLIVVGDFIEGAGEYREEILRQVAELRLERNVTFAGRVEHHTGLPEYYCAADLFVLPSHKEGFPGVILEAIACGLPVVATRVGETLRIVTRGTGIIVPIDDEAALQAGIEDILLKRFAVDRAEQEKLIAQYDYRSVARRLLEWYGDLLSSARTRVR